MTVSGNGESRRATSVVTCRNASGPEGTAEPPGVLRTVDWGNFGGSARPRLRWPVSDVVAAAIVTGAAAILAALGTQVIGARLARNARDAEAQVRREDRLAAEEERVRDLGAEVLGGVREYLVDADPTRVTINFKRGTESELIAKLTTHWEALRRPLATLAIRHPSKDVRSLTDDLACRGCLGPALGLLDARRLGEERGLSARLQGGP
jgi:hypothetical protein